MKKFLSYNVLQTLKIVFFIANSAGPNEMQHYAAFHQGLHCSPNYTFMGFQYTKGLKSHI